MGFTTHGAWREEPQVRTLLMYFLNLQRSLTIFRLPKTHSSPPGPLGPQDLSLPIRTHWDPQGPSAPSLRFSLVPQASFRPLGSLEPPTPKLLQSSLLPGPLSMSSGPPLGTSGSFSTLQEAVGLSPPNSPQPLLRVAQTASTTSRLPIAPAQDLPASQTPWHPQFPHGHNTVRSPWVSFQTSTPLKALSGP